MNSNDKLAELMAAATTLAKQKADGHLTILKFTSGWKVAFSTPDLDVGAGREQVAMLPTFKTLEEALQHLLEEQISFLNLDFWCNPNWKAEDFWDRIRKS